jgi:hypothetical protein
MLRISLFLVYILLNTSLFLLLFHHIHLNMLSQCKLKGYVHSRQSENRNIGCDVSVGCGDDKVRYKSELKIPRRDFAEESQIFSNYLTKLQRTSFSISANKHLTYSCYLNKLTSKLNSDDIIMRHKSLQGSIKLTFPVQVPKIRLLKTCSSQQSVVYISKLKL